MLRRQFVQCLLTLGVLWSSLANALANFKMAATQDSLEKAIVALFSNRHISTDETIKIEVRPVIENGAVVPVKINTSLANIHHIAIFVDKNPNPLNAVFNLSPACKGFIATRIKMGESSNIVVIVETEDGIYRNQRFVEVIEGGCA